MTVNDYILTKHHAYRQNTQVQAVQSGGSQQKVPDINCEVQDLLLEVVDLKQEVPDLRSGGIPPPNLTHGIR